MKNFPLLFMLVFVSACASSGDYDMMRRDINDVKRESLETRKEVEFLREKTTGVAREDSLAAIRESQAMINSRLSDISSGLQELRGRFEEYKYNTEKTLKDSVAERDIVRSQIASIEDQIRDLKEKLAFADTGETPPKAEQQPESEKSQAEQTEGGAAEEEQTATKEPSDAMIRAYEAAYQEFKDKKYREAREHFESFQKDFPQDKLAGNAQFWIAETYYAEKDFESAILAYETLLKKYPESDKASSASLKQGLAFIEIGDKKTGKTILARVVEKYSGSRDAALAKKKIAELEKKPTGKRR